MNQNPQQKLNQILAGMDAQKLKKSKQDIEAFLRTPEGAKLAASLGGADKEKLLKTFLSMDTAEIQKKLACSGFGSLPLEEILKHLR